MRSVITALLPSATPIASYATPKARHGNYARSQADPCVETIAFNQLMHLGRVMGSTWVWKKLILSVTSELVLHQFAPMCCLFLQGPQFL